MSKNTFAAPGSGARAAYEEAQSQLVGQNYADRRPLWLRGSQMLKNLEGPIWNTTLAAMNGTGGSDNPWQVTQAPTLASAYSPSSGLQGQVNPYLDVSGTGQQVYNANLATSTQTLADQYRSLMDRQGAADAQRGLTGTSFAPASQTALAIQQGQGAARNMAGALGQRLSTESGLRGEQRQGALSLADMLRQATIDQQGTQTQQYGMDRQATQDQIANYLQQIQTLMGYSGAMMGAGDTSGTAGQYGNLANSAAQRGQEAMAMWAPIANWAGGRLFGGG